MLEAWRVGWVVDDRTAGLRRGRSGPRTAIVMNVVARRERPAHSATGADEQERARSGGTAGVWSRPVARHGGIAAVTAAAGLAFAVLVGHDGSPGWRVARVAGVTVLAFGLVAVQTRAGDRARGTVAAAAGIVALAVGVGFLPFAVKDSSSLPAVAGMVLLVAGLLLAATGTVLGTRGRPVAWRIAAGVGTLVASVLAAFIVSPAVAATNVPRPSIGATPASVGLAYESVTLTTTDRVRLAGWYLPSTNRAAVVLLHGAGSTRSNVLDVAAVLAQHEFGVLLVDARGHGGSGGRAMDFGWRGDPDIAAATAYLANRPDVDRWRIGVVGMSMGGEQALGPAQRTS